MATKKTLLLRLADVRGLALGFASTTADVQQLTFMYDRHVAVDGQWIPPFETPVPVNSDGDGWQCETYCNDDPAVTAGQGFEVIVRLVLSPKQGLHAAGSTFEVRVAPMLASPDRIVVTQDNAVAAPWFLPGSNLAGVALWADPDTGEQIPYLAQPSDGTLTTLGGSHV